ncbi:GNAT family N-acetyltransferase [Kribbella sancticallisti]|uniref:GNAT family N-acetyltransferase n=1 Tax=Kribbella sancticallisti TaxID=460087 RepID=A0ABP4NU99_9ACTN
MADGLPDGLRIERLAAEHAEAVLAFEVENRAYFAASVKDRGDDYFTEFPARHAALLSEQEVGTIQFHLVLDGDQVIGRVNLVDLADGSAEFGYRIAEKAAGRGVATAAVGKVLELAAAQYGLTSLRAGTSARNKASQAVLLRAGFVQTGEVVAGDEPQVFYTRQLTA